MYFLQGSDSSNYSYTLKEVPLNISVSGTVKCSLKLMQERPLHEFLEYLGAITITLISTYNSMGGMASTNLQEAKQVSSTLLFKFDKIFDNWKV